jgi:hypothetical protein
LADISEVLAASTLKAVARSQKTVGTLDHNFLTFNISLSAAAWRLRLANGGGGLQIWRQAVRDREVAVLQLEEWTRCLVAVVIKTVYEMSERAS